MTKTKLIVILSIIVIIVCGTDYATTYYFHYKSSNLNSQNQNTAVTPPNMIRDTSNKIPSVFADLVLQKDLKAVRESYVYIDVQKPQTPKALPQSKVQHTFKYVTNQSATDALKYFTDLFNKNKIKPIVAQIDPTTTSLRGYLNVQPYDIIINSKDASNVVVEITMVK